MSVKPIAFSVRARLVIEGQQRTVPNDWIGGGSENAMCVTVSPNDVNRGREVKKGYLAMCEPTSWLIVVNQPLTQPSQPFPFLLYLPRRDGVGEIEQAMAEPEMAKIL